jgi:Beta-ketoacyl synthase, N-terminal domain
MSTTIATPEMTLCVRGIGLVGPGFSNWAEAQAALRDPASAWTQAPTVLVAPMLLPPAERRRAGTIVKLSLAVAEQACAMSGADPLELATVFSASSGDPANCHALCEVLASADRLVSPTRFTNSVHNASAGYWHIAQHARAPSTSLCGFDASLGAGLLEAAAQCATTQRPVMLVSSDVPYLEPLHGARPLPDSFGLALVLGTAAPSAAHASAARLHISIAPPGTAPTECDHPGLEALRRVIPAARCLPLLQALARGEPTELVLAYLDSLALAVRVEFPAA